MQIDGVNGLGSVSPSDGRKIPVRSADARSDEAEFQRSDAIQQALEQSPDIREDIVEKGVAMFNNTQYPPIPLIEGLARLLADRTK